MRPRRGVGGVAVVAAGKGGDRLVEECAEPMGGQVIEDSGRGSCSSGGDDARGGVAQAGAAARLDVARVVPQMVALLAVSVACLLGGVWTVL